MTTSISTQPIRIERPHQDEDCCGCREYQRLSRRQFLGATAAAGTASVLLPRRMMGPTFAQAAGGARSHTLIFVFLRGGADALSLLPPFGDKHYALHRPKLALAPPDAKGENAAIDLDGYFGLAPALAPLREVYSAGDLAFIHAVGSPSTTRSHFDAQQNMEDGTDGGTSTQEGWLSRYLATRAPLNPEGVRAIALASSLPSSLRGSPEVLAMNNLAENRLQVDRDEQDFYHAALSSLYLEADPRLADASRLILKGLKITAAANPEEYKPGGGAKYPGGPLGASLKSIAMLMKKDIGLEVAWTDVPGWDTHRDQGSVSGYLAEQMMDLADALKAFYLDTQSLSDRYTLIVQSEFGRRVFENSSEGTAHGHGGCMFLIGGGIRGGRVVTQWPGLAQEQLFEERDLEVTIDYRDVLAETIAARTGLPAAASVFPGRPGQPIGVT